MFRRSFFVGLSLLLSIALTACITRGTSFSSDYSWIEKDKTSKSDVKQRLGEPYLVGYSSGRPSWTYGIYNLRIIGESHTKELTIYWQPNGLVDSFTFRSNFPEDRSKELGK